jgi:hypothetical protein
VRVAFGKALGLIALPLSVSAIVGIYFSFSPNADAPGAIGFVVCAVWAMAIVGMAVKAAWRARWRRCFGLIAILLVGLPMSGVLWRWAGDYVHLAVMWPTYRSTIQAEPGSRVMFEWETVEMMFGQIERTLVYDPSDGEAHAKDTHDDYQGWFRRHRHLVGHFYLIENKPWKGCMLQKADAC